MKRPIPHSLLLALLLTACTVGPDFKAPDAPATKAYMAEDEALPPDLHIALGKQIDAEWWTLFSSSTLNDVIVQAMAKNYNITAAKESLAQADEAVKAENGSLLPQVSVNATAGRQKYGVALFGPSNFTIPPFTYYEAGPSATWSLDLFGKKRRSIEEMKALAEYQAFQLDVAYVGLTGSVVEQALNYATAKAEIAATERIIAEDEKTLKLVQGAFKAGSETKVNILAAQSQLDNNRADLPALKQQMSVARHALSILVGEAPADWTPPDFSMQDFTLPSELPLSLPSELVRKRPDIRAAEANLHAASAAVGVATANLYPDITLSASTLQEALVPAKLFDGVSNAWSLAAGVSAPIFTGGTLSAEKSRAEHAYQEALARYHETIIESFGDVANALTALSHDRETVGLQKQAVDTARSSLNLARQSYQAGNTSLLQIQDNQRLLAQAERGLIRAQSQEYLDTVSLFVALGGSPLSSSQ